MFPIILSLLALFLPFSTHAAPARNQSAAPAWPHVQIVHNTLQSATVRSRASVVPDRTTKSIVIPAPAPAPAPSQPVITPVPTPTPAGAPQPITPAPTPTPPQTPSDFASQIESLVLQYTNDQRAANGLAPLASDTKLAAIARAHSADMLAKKYFQHDDLSGCSPECRINNAGYAWQAWGENIHWTYGYTFTAEEAAHGIVNDWMNSPGHRANILNTSFTKAGVGIAVSGTIIYATTDYALPR